MRYNILFSSFLLIFSFISFNFTNAQVTQEWAARYNRPGNSEDKSSSMAVDKYGNVYVTGSSIGNYGSPDYATIKYNSSGVQQWAARYDYPVSSFDEASSIAVDVSGNVYVTGYSVGNGTGDDYATIKYNSSGVQQWVARYNGPENSSDKASSIAVDVSGNVYVTGYSVGSGTGDDYVTIKYNSSGLQQWVARYNGLGNSSDRAYSITIDASGNVYVTGYSVGSGTLNDYATIKYNSLGVQQWAVRYNGPGNSFDEASSIAVDGSGNIYVTGKSYGSGTDIDYATIKYNSAGVQQWVTRFNGPANGSDGASSIAVDISGNVYVTGNSYTIGTQADYATIKYNSSGNMLWYAIYNGTSNGPDYAYSIEIDVSGNVYVAGYSMGSGTSYNYATIKYNSAGAQQWNAIYNGPGNSYDYAYSMAVDSSGNVYVAGWSEGSGTDYDYATIKYNSTGVQQWAARYNGPENLDDKAYSLAIDGSGNVYVTGTSEMAGFINNYTTIKYNSSGVQQWVARYDGPGPGQDIAQSIAADFSGNVYVTGWSEGSGTGSDYATIKYNTTGVQQWVARYNGPANIDDRAYSIAVDNSGNVYVTGFSFGSGGTVEDYATIKYNSSGIQQWAARYNGTGNRNDEAYSIAVDNSGNVYVTGMSEESTNSDYATIKYNSSGVQQWVARYNGPGNLDDIPNSLAIDGSGNVYVTGSSIGSGGKSDYTTIKYNSSGVQQWAVRYDGPENDNDRAIKLAVDGSGNVYVTGYSMGSGTLYDYATIKYNNTGVQQWVARYNGPENKNDWANSLAVDGSGNVYVTGSSVSESYMDYVTIKYNSAGVQEWAIRYNGPNDENDEANSLAVDGSGNVYVTGYSMGSGTENDFTTIKYSQQIGIKNISTEIPSSYSLSQNYPNPFNPTTKIKFDIPQDSRLHGNDGVLLVVYDILGREIATLVNEQLKAGTYEVDFDARQVGSSSELSSGVYYYKLISGDYTETKKMILIK